jgi:hypothetical protein
MPRLSMQLRVVVYGTYACKGTSGTLRNRAQPPTWAALGIRVRSLWAKDCAWIDAASPCGLPIGGNSIRVSSTQWKSVKKGR